MSTIRFILIGLLTLFVAARYWVGKSEPDEDSPVEMMKIEWLAFLDAAILCATLLLCTSICYKLFF